MINLNYELYLIISFMYIRKKLVPKLIPLVSHWMLMCFARKCSYKIQTVVCYQGDFKRVITTHPVIPRLYSFYNKILWFSVSDAFDRSIKIPTYCFSSIYWHTRTLWRKYKTAVSVKQFVLKPCWYLVIRFLSQDSCLNVLL